MFSAESVKQLREKTGAGMMDCKNALSEAKGDFDLAIEILRKKGLKDIGKRTGRTAAEGAIGVYVHPGDQVVAIVELNCETDFVARGEEFKRTARDIAMHVAAMKPLYTSIEEVPAAIVEKEKEIAFVQLNDAQKAKADKILAGKLEGFYKETVLLSQPYCKDEAKSVKEVVDELSVKTGEKVVVRRFQRFQVGEGIQKAVQDLAADVAATIGQ